MVNFILIGLSISVVLLGLVLCETIRQVRELNLWKKEITELCKASMESQDA